MSREVFRVARYRFRSTFRRRRAGYAALVVLVGVVGGIALASVAAARRTEASYPAFLAGTNASDLLVQPTTNVGYRSPFVRQVERLPHVRHVETAIALNAATFRPDGSLGTVLLTRAQLVVSLDGLFSDQDRVTIVAGRRADPARADEVVVSTPAARELGLHVGSHVSVGLYTENQQTVTPTRRLDLTVVGEGVFNNAVIQDDIDKFSTGFLLGTPALARSAAPCCTSLTYEGLQLDRGSEDDRQVEQEYAALVRRSRFTGSSGQQLQVYVTADIEAAAQRAIRPEALALALFGIIAGLTTVVVAGLTIVREVRSGSPEVEVLRDVGAGPPVTSTDGLVGLVGAVGAGSAMAVAVAVLLSPLSPFGPVRAIAGSAGITVDRTVLGLGAVGLFVALTVVATWTSYRQAPHRVAARERAANRPSVAVRAAASGGVPAPGIVGLRFALEPGAGRTAVPARTAIAGAVVAAFVVAATLTFGASLDTLISHPGLYGWNFDEALVSTDGFGPVPTRLARPLLARERDVAATTGVYFASVDIDGLTVPVIAAPTNAAVTPPILTGRRVKDQSEIVVGTATLARLHKRIGDSVIVGAGFIPRVRLRIVGTATLPTLGQTFGAHPTLSTGAEFSTAIASASALHNFGPYSGPNAVLVRFRRGIDDGAGRRSLQQIADSMIDTFRSPPVVEQIGLAGYGISEDVLGVQRPAEIVNYRSMGRAPALLAVAVAVGAVGALALSLVASVRRRRHEMAMLKALGFTRRQLVAAVACQSTVVVALGVVIGLPLGVAFGRWLWVLFAHTLSAVPKATIPVGSIALVVLAALVLANLVAAVPGYQAARTPTATLLRED